MISTIPNLLVVSSDSTSAWCIDVCGSYETLVNSQDNYDKEKRGQGMSQSLATSSSGFINKDMNTSIRWQRTVSSLDQGLPSTTSVLTSFLNTIILLIFAVLARIR